MISVDSTALSKDLEQFYKDVVRKLENMVRGFAYEVTLSAIDNTPFGDDVTYQSLYNLPSRLKFAPAKAGSAKGGWVISMNGMDGDMFPMQASSREATDVKNKAKQDSSNYQLGDTVYITNFVPYVTHNGWTLPRFGSLEAGYSEQAPFGIKTPTLEQVQATYKVNLQRYYDQG